MYKPGGRGGGRGGSGPSKRPPAPHGRGRGAGSSIGGGKSAPPRGRAAAAAAAAAAAQAAARDESFSLESHGPPAFAAIVRLTPDLIDEIRRAEESGSGARIKFNPNMINPAENVSIIDVGGKEFQFSWASERGELCDIYEERQSGEDGNGLLLECGSAWRKVNVQRILDESAKNLVKMRSEEAERRSKSRKSIVLDPANPSVKSQAKSMTAAAVEGNMRRMHWKQKKEFFKKNAAAVIAPTKSVSKVKVSNSAPKGNFSTSPALSPQQPGPSIPSLPVGSDANNEVITPFDLNKDENSKVEKSTPNRTSQGINRRQSAVSASIDDNTNELRRLLISVLSENPKGMNLKGLEKAVADAFPNASKRIESIIKNIANFQAPGRYLLKPGLESESSKRHAPGSGISIDDNTEEAAPSLRMGDPDIFETIDIGGSPVSAAQDGKVNNDDDGKAGSSSESGSGSDSDSESSDSGSDSGSQSRSAGSGSGSSSDSDSDASSSSKEGSDAFVDITSDDDKGGAGRKAADELKLSSSPRDLTAFDGDDELIDIGTNLDYKSASPHIDLNNFNNNNDDSAYTAVPTDSHLEKPPEIPGDKDMVNTSKDPSRTNNKYAANEMFYEDIFGDPLAPSSENLPKEEISQSTKHHGSRRKSVSKDGSNHGQDRIVEKGSKPKLKRCSGNENASTMPGSAKRAKADYAGTTSSLSEHRQSLPADKHVNERLSKETGNVSWDEHSDLHAHDSSPAMKGRPLASGVVQKINQSPNVLNQAMHSERTQDKVERSISKKKADKMQKPWNSLDGNLERISHGEDQFVNFDDSDDSVTRKRARYGGPQVEDKMLKRSKDAYNDVNSMISAKSAKGNIGYDGVMPFPDSNESNGQPSKLQRNNAESSPHGKKVLQRELSDLELGEFREASLENETGRTKKQFERNSSSKSLDAKFANVDNSIPSMANRKGSLSSSQDQRKLSPRELGIGGNIYQEGIPKKTPGYDFENNRSQKRGNVQQNQQLPKADNPVSEIVSYLDQSGEKPGKREARKGDHAGPKKISTTPKLPQNGSTNAIGSRTRKSISPVENEERSRNNSLIENEAGRKRRDSSSDEDNLFFSKYDKDEPELKGPIKDFSQYKNYVQEYNEKYEVYSYLNNQIEKTRSEFLKIQEDLNAAKERDKDLYYNILERIRDMYHESGTRHKLMKKVFLLLHEELQGIC
uniref:OCEL domain-containing protein n=1 Tax=Leersia perrieri TaxID=77586 RepID=A0A0D9VQH3_9ORYZ